MKFFSIITGDISTQSRLRLPHKFVERYGENMPRIVSLEVSTGAKLRVEVKKKVDRVWFGKGWSRFAESLGLKYGHFLMFDYDDMHAVFHVVVIDTGAAEIEYPALSCIIDADDQGGSYWSASDPKVEVEQEDVVIVMNQDDSNSGSQPPLSEDHRKTAKASKSENDGGVDHSPNGSENEMVETTIKKGHLSQEIILNSKGRIQCVVQGRKVKKSRSEQVVALAKSYKAEEPFCIIVIQPSYVSRKGAYKRCQPLFPRCFIDTYFNLNIRDATLRTNDGMTWSVKYSLSGAHQSLLSCGWKQFSIDNNVRTGDVCLFELIRGAENALKVVIFRSGDQDEAPNQIYKMKLGKM